MENNQLSDNNLNSTLNVLYADDDLIAFNKPSGLLSVPGKGPDKQDCLMSRAIALYPNSRSVHRLDMATSGIILVPQSHYCLSELSKQFQNRSIQKTYTAIVEGRVENASGIIDLPLICDWPNRPKQMVCHTRGKPSQTYYEVDRYIDSGKNKISSTRVILTPITGRSHQLRVHMQALGHCILGDNFYASDAALVASNRLLLHATSIAFTHPVSGKAIEVFSPPEF
jgi:tRNA pseudouridine32 synthase/23S rRNA pseudouridine746 synthase